MSEIWILVEHRDNKVAPSTLELIEGAKKIGDSVKFVLLAKESAGLVDQLGGYGVTSALVVENEKLTHYTPDGYSQVLTSLIKDKKPRALLATHSSMGWDLAPKLALSVDGGIVTNGISLEMDGDNLIFVRPAFGQKLLSKEKMTRPAPWIITLPGGTYLAPEKAGGDLSVEKVEVEVGEVRWEVLGVETAAAGGVNLEEAEIIVAGGRGLKEADKFRTLLEPLAEVLGGVIGASRPVVDDEWLPRDRQVGSSGKTVKPKLYLAIGISGQTQHIAGMKNSGCIVAINKDPEAPIFDYAHYGLVGDLFEIVPKLTEKLKEAK